VASEPWLSRPIEHGLSVYGVDASPRMIAAFRANFPVGPVGTHRDEGENHYYFGHKKLIA
jgi:hypothetical protein